MAIRNEYLKKIEYVDYLSGRTCYRLINLETGETVPFFTEYLKKRAFCDAPANTVKAVANDLKTFLSYLFKASEVIAKDQSFDASALSDVIFAYPEFLQLATNASSDLAKQTALILDATPVKLTSRNRMLSSVHGFILESASYQSIMDELSELGLINTEQAPYVFGKELLARRHATNTEQKMLIHHSFLAGCVSGGARFFNTNFFKRSTGSVGPSCNIEKAFPIDSIKETIEHARTYRDRALWSLLSGTGIRVSEALNLLLDDVDGINGEVNIIDPRTRPHRYPGVGEMLSYKGRSTQETYFVEPFKSIFFESLSLYLQKERISANHEVLFINMSNHERGRPLYFAKNSNTYNRPFRLAASKAGVNGYSVHSLRHMYGVYVLNFIPTPHGYGLPIQTVQLMMGHVKVESTQKYAIQDTEIVKNKIGQFEASIESGGFSVGTLSSKPRELLGNLSDISNG